MTRNLLSEALEHDRSEDELESWYGALSDDEKEQLREEWEQLKHRVEKMFEQFAKLLDELRNVVLPSLEPLLEWFDRSQEL